MERARVAGKTVIDDASAFVKSNPNTSRLLEFLQQIADLNIALNGDNPVLIERQLAALRLSLGRDPSYTQFQAQRRQDQQNQNARYLADAVIELQAQKLFLISQLTQNPTGPNSAKFLPLVGQINSALATPNLDESKTLIGRIDLAVQEGSLLSSYKAFRKSSEGVEKSVGDRTHVAEAQANDGVATPPLLSLITAKNRFLIEGDLQDIVLIYNAGSSAPHVVKNLRGDIVFQDGRVDACVFNREDDDVLGNVVRSTLAAYPTARTILIGTEPCDAARILSFDIVCNASRRVSASPFGSSFQCCEGFGDEPIQEPRDRH